MVSDSKAGALITIFAVVYAAATPFVLMLLGPRSHYLSLLALTCLFILRNLLSFLSAPLAATTIILLLGITMYLLQSPVLPDPYGHAARTGAQP